MTKKPGINDVVTPKIAAKYKRGDRMETDGSLTIFLRNTNTPFARIKPEYNPGLGAHVSFYRVTEGQEEHCLTLHLGAIYSLMRWLPLIVSAAKRKANQAASTK